MRPGDRALKLLTSPTRGIPVVPGATALVLAIERGAPLACQMPICLHPLGRTYFDAKVTRGRPGHGSEMDWTLSPDRIQAARDGGEYKVDNVRASHLKCNITEGSAHGGPPSGTDCAGLQKGRCSWARGGECNCGQHGQREIASGLMGL